MPDLVFVDSDKLNQLDREFYPDSEVVRGSPGFEAEVSDKGASAKVTREKRYQLPTVHEQLARVKDSLRRTGQLAEFRPKPNRATDVKLRYVEESIEAVRVLVPPLKENDPRFRTLSIWYTAPSEVFGPLVLLEDLRAPLDGTASALHPRPHSSYSSLQSFLYYAHGDILRTRIASKLPVKEKQPGEPDELHLPSAIAETKAAREHALAFAENADRLLAEWGCAATGPHHVKVFYYVREFGEEDALPESALGKRISIFGYPIVIERQPVNLPRTYKTRERRS